MRLTRKKIWVNKGVAFSVSLVFLVSFSFPPQTLVYAQSVLNLPAPGTMVNLSQPFTPSIVKGITIHLDNPLKFNFIIQKGDANLGDQALKEESQKLIKYFLSALTTPEEELWVNLNPNEQDKITTPTLGATELGRDLLAQDYLLKQLTASLIYPEGDLGKDFWDRVHKKVYEAFGDVDIPVSTFNKVWIIPNKAVVYTEGETAFILQSSLRVMLEEDYLALDKTLKGTVHTDEEAEDEDVKEINNVSSSIVREIVLPELEKEVNEGKNFALLRQIYNSLILATWYKKNLKESLLAKVYIDQGKIGGVEVDDIEIKDKIYDQYLQAYKKGVYNYIREDYDPNAQKAVPRNYFSGGVRVTNLSNDLQERTPANISPVELDSARRDIALLRNQWIDVPVSLEATGSRQQASIDTVKNSPLIRTFNVPQKPEPVVVIAPQMTEQQVHELPQQIANVLEPREIAGLKAVQVTSPAVLENRPAVFNEQTGILHVAQGQDFGGIRRENIGRATTAELQGRAQSASRDIDLTRSIQSIQVPEKSEPVVVIGPQMTEQQVRELPQQIANVLEPREIAGLKAVQVTPPAVLENRPAAFNRETGILHVAQGQDLAGIRKEDIGRVTTAELQGRAQSALREINLTRSIQSIQVPEKPEPVAVIAPQMTEQQVRELPQQIINVLDRSEIAGLKAVQATPAAVLENRPAVFNRETGILHVAQGQDLAGIRKEDIGRATTAELQGRSPSASREIDLTRSIQSIQVPEKPEPVVVIGPQMTEQQQRELPQQIVNVLDRNEITGLKAVQATPAAVLENRPAAFNRETGILHVAEGQDLAGIRNEDVGRVTTAELQGRAQSASRSIDLTQSVQSIRLVEKPEPVAVIAPQMTEQQVRELPQQIINVLDRSEIAGLKAVQATPAAVLENRPAVFNRETGILHVAEGQDLAGIRNEDVGRVTTAELQGRAQSASRSIDLTQSVQSIRLAEKPEPVAVIAPQMTEQQVRELPQQIINVLDRSEIAGLKAVQATPAAVLENRPAAFNRETGILHVAEGRSLSGIQRGDVDRVTTAQLRGRTQSASREIDLTQSIRSVQLTDKPEPVTVMSKSMPEAQMTQLSSQLPRLLNKEQLSNLKAIQEVERLPIGSGMVYSNDGTLFLSQKAARNPTLVLNNIQEIKSVPREAIVNEVNRALKTGTQLDQNPAGINLNPKNMDMNVTGQPTTQFKFKDINIDMKQLQESGFDGFIPVIENLIPIQTLPILSSKDDLSYQQVARQ